MKKAGIALIVIQIIAFIGNCIYCSVTKTALFGSIPSVLGKFAFGIIGISLLIADITCCFAKANKSRTRKRIKIMVIVSFIVLTVSFFVSIISALYYISEETVNYLNFYGAWLIFLFYFAIFGWRIIADFYLLYSGKLNCTLPRCGISVICYERSRLLQGLCVVCALICAFFMLAFGVSIPINSRFAEILPGQQFSEKLPDMFTALWLVPTVGAVVICELLCLSVWYRKIFETAFEETDDFGISELKQRCATGKISEGEYRSLRDKRIKIWYHEDYLQQEREEEKHKLADG